MLDQGWFNSDGVGIRTESERVRACRLKPLSRFKFVECVQQSMKAHDRKLRQTLSKLKWWNRELTLKCNLKC